MISTIAFFALALTASVLMVRGVLDWRCGWSVHGRYKLPCKVLASIVIQYLALWLIAALGIFSSQVDSMQIAGLLCAYASAAWFAVKCRREAKRVWLREVWSKVRV